MENTLENKQRFFALYWGQEVFNNGFMSDGGLYFTGSNYDEINNGDFMILKPLSSITDEDLQQVARYAHEQTNLDFVIERNKDIFYATSKPNNVGIYYFISMMPKYGTVCATINFEATETEKYHYHTVNIGKINLSARRPLAYIMIVDYLRSKGYALPYMGLSVEKLVEYGWVNLKKQ